MRKSLLLILILGAAILGGCVTLTPYSDAEGISRCCTITINPFTPQVQ